MSFCYGFCGSNHCPHFPSVLLGLSVGDACWIPEVVGERAAGPGNNLLGKRMKSRETAEIPGHS